MQNLFEFYSRWNFKRRVSRVVRKGIPLRLNLGAGGTNYPGWISAERYEFDLTKPTAFSDTFVKDAISNVLAEHVIEHIYRKDFELFLHKIRPFMKPDSVIRIAVPDAWHPSAYVRELTKPGGLEPGADDHKEFYSFEVMKDVAARSKFDLRPVEWFDESGSFHYEDDDWSNGYIARSRKNYAGRFTSSPEEHKRMLESVPDHLREQFFKLEMSYTSLIVDFKISI